MYKCSILLQFILLLTCTSALAQESETKKKLIGNWIYSGLEYKGPINEETMQEMEKANKQNKNLVVTFNADGTYLIWNKTEGKNEPYAEGKVELTRKGKHLKIEGLEGCYVKTRGLFYFARLCSKIRVHAQGRHALSGPHHRGALDQCPGSADRLDECRAGRERAAPR